MRKKLVTSGDWTVWGLKLVPLVGTGRFWPHLTSKESNSPGSAGLTSSLRCRLCFCSPLSWICLNRLPFSLPLYCHW